MKRVFDFEQLKIENQTLNEKIEERTEELALTTSGGAPAYFEEGITQVIKDVKLAIDYDEIASLQAEGYELMCRFEKTIISTLPFFSFPVIPFLFANLCYSLYIL
jgi:hypothetical protein